VSMMRAIGRAHLSVLLALLGLLAILCLPDVNAGVTQQNWNLILVGYGYQSSSYGNIYYYYEVYKFAGYTQAGYHEWYAVYLRDIVDPVNPSSNNDGFTVAGKAGQSATGGGVGPYIYDKYGVFGIYNLIPQSSQTSCAQSWSETFSVSASISKNGPAITASYTQSTSWRANGVSWSLTDVYPKSHWEFWHCNEPPPSSAELGAAWTFEITVAYIKTYPTYPGTQTYTIELGPAAGFRHWYQSCFLFWCWWEWDYSVHWNIPVTISFSNS